MLLQLFYFVRPIQIAEKYVIALLNQNSVYVVRYFEYLPFWVQIACWFRYTNLPVSLAPPSREWDNALDSNREWDRVLDIAQCQELDPINKKSRDLRDSLWEALLQ
jgi:hypothetical protein